MKYLMVIVYAIIIIALINSSDIIKYVCKRKR